MATWYTDNIAGNDTTGDGTIATPYKTIKKAYEVAANDDTINVAGSGWSAVTGTVTPTAFAASTITTSSDLTSQLPVGTLISFKDTAGFGNRKLIYKVNIITATTITLNSNQYYEPGVNYEIEKLTTNYYSTISNIVFEDLTGVAYEKSGIQIEGGWVDNFTAQTGVTAMVHTPITPQSTGIRFSTSGTQNNPALNNFCFSVATPYTFTLNPALPVVYLGNIWSSGGTITNISSCQKIPGKECNLHLIGSFTGAANNTTANATRWTIDNLYVTAGLFSSVRQPVLIENVWQRAFGTSNTVNSNGSVTITNAIINNWNTIWRSTAATQAQAMLASAGYYIIKNVTQLGDLTNKILTPTLTCDSTIQFINESLNVESFGFKNTPSSPNIAITQQSCIARDIEGDKNLWQNAYWLYADSSVYDTGTNSLRIKPTNQTSLPWAPIKSVYIPEGSTTAKIVTVRAKATTSINCIFGIGQAGSIDQSQSSICFESISATNSLTTSWADFSFTLTSGQITQWAGSYLQIGLQANSSTSEHIWIDSVTIS